MEMNERVCYISIKDNCCEMQQYMYICAFFVSQYPALATTKPENKGII